MNVNYLDFTDLWSDGYSIKEVIAEANKSYEEWQKNQKNKKIEEARAAMIAAVANYLEALGQPVEQKDIDRTIATLEKLEAYKPDDVQVSIGVDADEKIRKFLRGIM